MKTRYAEEVRHSGTVDSDESFLMSLDMTSLPHVQSILTNIYSDKELAVVREISTNALDSHRQAGVTDPIDVTLPNSFNPTFVVKDHGLGMSEAQVRDEFSKYGASSKRETDIAVGYLGIGCKSPLTYTSQFTMTCIKDGKKIVVLITKNEQNIGEINIVGRYDTDEPNGVEVQVPVNDFYSFNEKARRFYWFWSPGDVEIDGEPHEDSWDLEESGMRLSDSCLLTTGLRSDYVVMGNVPYPVERRLTDHNYGNYTAVVRVPIGAVDFTPSREALHYTKRTEGTVDNTCSFIAENVAIKAQEEVDAADSHAEAYDIAKRWRQILGQLADFTYKGDYVPVNFRPSDGEGILTWNDNGIYEGRYYAAKWTTSIQLEQARRSVHVIGFTSRTLTQQYKRAINRWRSENDIDQRSIILTNEPLGRPWVGDVPEVTWAELKKLVVYGPKKSTERFKVIGNHGKTVIVSSLDSPLQSAARTRRSKSYRKGRVVWIESGWSKDRRSQLADACGDGVLIVLVDAKSIKRWKKDHPEILHARQYAALRAARISAQMTDHDSWLMDHSYEWSQNILSSLNADEINDPDVAELIRNTPKRAGEKDERQSRYQAADKLCDLLNVEGPTRPPASDLTLQLESIQERYPLLGVVDDYDLRRRGGIEQGLYDYINALWIVHQHDYTHTQDQEKKAA